MRDLKWLETVDLLWIIEHSMSKDAVENALDRLYMDKALRCQQSIDELREELRRKQNIYRITKSSMSMSDKLRAREEMEELQNRIAELAGCLSENMREVRHVG